MSISIILSSRLWILSINLIADFLSLTSRRYSRLSSRVLKNISCSQNFIISLTKTGIFLASNLAQLKPRVDVANLETNKQQELPENCTLWWFSWINYQCASKDPRHSEYDGRLWMSFSWYRFAAQYPCHQCCWLNLMKSSNTDFSMILHKTILEWIWR